MQIFLEVFILDLLFDTAKQLFADIINSINPSSMRSTSSKLVVIAKFNLLNIIFPRFKEIPFKMFYLFFSVVTILCNFQFARPLTDSYSQKTQSTPWSCLFFLSICAGLSGSVSNISGCGEMTKAFSFPPKSDFACSALEGDLDKLPLNNRLESYRKGTEIKYEYKTSRQMAC